MVLHLLFYVLAQAALMLSGNVPNAMQYVWSGNVVLTRISLMYRLHTLSLEICD